MKILNLRSKNNDLKAQSGQGLVETILASVIVIMVVYSLVNLGIIAMRSANLANERSKATLYANEGIEAVRILRDDPALGWSTIGSFPSGTWLCYEDDNLSNLVDCALSDENDVEEPDAGLEGKYVRKVSFQAIYRESSVAQGDSCPNPTCPVCGGLLNSGDTNYGAADYIDTCSRQVMLIVYWRGLTKACQDFPGLRRNCVKSSTILTSWR